MKTKQCKDCGERKPFLDFGIRKTINGTYLKAYCKTCMSRRSKEWRETNADRYKQYQKEYHNKQNE